MTQVGREISRCPTWRMVMLLVLLVLGFVVVVVVVVKV